MYKNNKDKLTKIVVQPLQYKDLRMFSHAASVSESLFWGVFWKAMHAIKKSVYYHRVSDQLVKPSPCETLRVCS